MNKNALIAVLGLAVAVLLALLLWPEPGPGGPEYGEVDVGRTVVGENGVTNVVTKTTTVVDGVEKTVISAVPADRSVERRPLEPEATKRLHDGPVVVTALFEASGRAEHGSYGKTIRGSFLYTTTVRARSEIVSKEEDGTTGAVRVVEKRTFLQARDHLALSDLDVALDLETLPVRQVKGWIDGACDFVGGVVGVAVPAARPLAGLVKKEVAAVFGALASVDGVSARWLLGAFNVEVPDNVETFVKKRLEQIAGRELDNVKVALQSIEGRTYVVTYRQAANGLPLNVDFAPEGGGGISDAEWEILRGANAFLDANAVPDARCRVGDGWTIWADEAQELFGAAGEGRAEGKIRVKRAGDLPDGTWTLEIEPSEIAFKTTDGTAAGTMRVKGGNGLVDPGNASVKSLQATAEGDLRSLGRKRHALFFEFVKKLDGNANLRFALSVDPADQTP